MKTQALTGRLAPFRFMQSPSLNGIAFTAQPEAPAFVLAGASGWAVNDYNNTPRPSAQSIETSLTRFDVARFQARRGCEFIRRTAYSGRRDLKKAIDFGALKRASYISSQPRRADTLANVSALQA